MKRILDCLCSTYKHFILLTTCLWKSKLNRRRNHQVDGKMTPNRRQTSAASTWERKKSIKCTVHRSPNRWASPSNFPCIKPKSGSPLGSYLGVFECVCYTSIVIRYCQVLTCNCVKWQIIQVVSELISKYVTWWRCCNPGQPFKKSRWAENRTRTTEK